MPHTAHSFGYLFLSTLLSGCSTSLDSGLEGNSPTPEHQPSAETEKALTVKAATGPAAPQQNPFAGASFFVNPSYAERVLASIEDAPGKETALREVAQQPTAIWLDRIAALERVPSALDQAAARTRAEGKPSVPVFVVYDLPNRDCSAKASAGELHAEAEGEMRYRREFIDEIAREFARRPDQRIVAILEPDSLPNLATNMEVPKCAASADLYKRSIAYAIATLSLPNVYLYVDAAHTGWLGWDANRNAMAQIYGEVLEMAGGAERIRGFASNVSNYNALDGDWGWKLESSNPCPSEYCYIEKLNETLAAAGIRDKGFIIDTSRNGVAETRSKWGHWCNVKGAGLGARPAVAPRALVDAYYWVKPPGESDGVSDPKAPRFDAYCMSADSAPDAPQAGEWFSSYFLELVENANPPL
ncbi:MAG TPA: glycoside hydrolase family 6 protein [Polyangiaceae bacterium]|nr:glycoside hydrolase family 6 protein [Polyangiaceae bacterium]